MAQLQSSDRGPPRRRAFFIVPDASGKSNILDALRFLRDVAGDGLQGAVAVRGGTSEIRSLHTRRFPSVRIAVDVGSRKQPARWLYELHFRVYPQKHVPIIEGECVSRNGETILERPDDKDREDTERLTQTHLEQVSENQKFRVLARFFESVRYLHIVPHVVREFRRDGDYRGDPFRSDFLEQIAATNIRSRECGDVDRTRSLSRGGHRAPRSGERRPSAFLEIPGNCAFSSGHERQRACRY